jgi:hypothetical protein
VELKYYKSCRKKNEPIKAIAQRMGISVAFLTGLEKYLKLKIECRDCHNIVKNAKGLYTRYCPVCLKRRIHDQRNVAFRKAYRTDPVYRAKWLGIAKNNKLKKSLT